jgi:CheY-like chemotaxis protein
MGEDVRERPVMDPQRSLPEQRILAVDDDPSVQAALGKALRKRGYHVDLSPSAEEALARMERTTYSLILLDVNLPGMSGIDAIPRI